MPHETSVRAIGRLWRGMVPHGTRVMAAHGVPLVYWQLMSGLAYDGLRSQVALSKRALLDPARTSRILGELETLGLVRRARAREDRRRVTLSLTPAGRRWYARARREVMKDLAPLFSRLSPKELRTLETLLLKLSPAPTGYSSYSSAGPGP